MHLVAGPSSKALPELNLIFFDYLLYFSEANDYSKKVYDAIDSPNCHLSIQLLFALAFFHLALNQLTYKQIKCSRKRELK